MMCPDMDVETKVLGVLDKVNGYVETPEGIALTDADGKTLMNLEKRADLKRNARQCQPKGEL